MTDYTEEQSNEIEALQSIYHDTFEVLSEDPHCFTLKVSAENEEEEDHTVLLQFTFTPTYPDEPPEYELLEVSGMDDSDENRILEIIKAEVEENLGMVMVFTVISAVQEYLNDLKELLEKRAEEELARQEKLREEAEQKKFHGTPVTVETFLAWKMKFDKEMELKKQEEMRASDTGRKKLTGKQLFMKDNSLMEDELLVGEQEAVAVDESLFQDLDDFDLEDDSDDEDFDPSLYS